VGDVGWFGQATRCFALAGVLQRWCWLGAACHCHCCWCSSARLPVFLECRNECLSVSVCRWSYRMRWLGFEQS
jgi:hypothetical protein